MGMSKKKRVFARIAALLVVFALLNSMGAAAVECDAVANCQHFSVCVVAAQSPDDVHSDYDNTDADDNADVYVDDLYEQATTLAVFLSGDEMNNNNQTWTQSRWDTGLRLFARRGGGSLWLDGVLDVPRLLGGTITNRYNPLEEAAAQHGYISPATADGRLPSVLIAALPAFGGEYETDIMLMFAASELDVLSDYGDYGDSDGADGHAENTENSGSNGDVAAGGSDGSNGDVAAGGSDGSDGSSGDSAGGGDGVTDDVDNADADSNDNDDNSNNNDGNDDNSGNYADNNENSNNDDSNNDNNDNDDNSNDSTDSNDVNESTGDSNSANADADESTDAPNRSPNPQTYGAFPMNRLLAAAFGLIISSGVLFYVSLLKMSEE